MGGKFSERDAADAPDEPIDAAERERLDPLYHATTYVAELPGGTCRIRIGRTHPDLDAALEAENATQWAYVTAWNPYSVDTSAEVNAERQAQLEAALRALRSPVVRFHRGVSEPDDGGAGEESVLAFIDSGEAMALARRFRQNAIVVGEKGGVAELLWLR